MSRWCWWRRGCRRISSSYVDATTLEGAKQTIAQGPVASQVAIKQLGTNGGGFFNANSAHPFENPNALTNLIEMWAILVISAALTYTFGRMVGNTRQGWAIFAAMGVLFLAGLVVTYWAEGQGNPALAALHVDQTPSALQAGGNMEGKEVRFGIANSALWAVATTDASNGSVNSMHDSYTPLGGLVPMINIQLGEVIFGGVGSGLYGMLLFAILAVFIAGLMVGRTPEYLGKKIEAKEVKMAMLAILILPLSILGFTALARFFRPVSQDRRTRARTASAKSSTPTPRGPATTAAPSPGCQPTRPSTTRRSASRCCSAGSSSSCR